MVAVNFLCSAAIALFWFIDMRASHGRARTANHHGRYPPEHISRHIWVGNASVHPALSIWVGPLETLLPIFCLFGHGLSVWLGPLEIP
jgi:hypothetical protein